MEKWAKRMSKTLVNDVLMSPVYKIIKEERKADERCHRQMMLMVDREHEIRAAERNKPKVFDVHQPWDSIIHEDRFW